MTADTSSPLAVGMVFEVVFATFTPRITIDSEQQMTLEIVAGKHAGFTDSIPYQAVAVRDGLVVLSWQEHVGSTIVQVLDFHAGKSYTSVTPAKGGFEHMTGRIEIKSGGA